MPLSGAWVNYEKTHHQELTKNENRLMLPLEFINLLRAQSCMVGTTKNRKPNLLHEMTSSHEKVSHEESLHGLIGLY